MRKIFKGQVFLYNFKENDEGNIYGGERPVISIANIKGKQFMLCPITSKEKRKDLGLHVPLAKEETYFLDKASWVVTEQVFTRIKDKQIGPKLGEVKAKVLNSVIANIEKNIMRDKGKSSYEYGRGDIITYKTLEGEICMGMIIENNKGINYSNTIMLIPVSRNEKIYECNPVFGGYQFKIKFVDTIDRVQVQRVVENVPGQLCDIVCHKFIESLRQG